MNYELLKYQDKNNAVQMARQRRRKAKTTALFLKGYLAQKARGRITMGNTPFLE